MGEGKIFLLNNCCIMFDRSIFLSISFSKTTVKNEAALISDKVVSKKF